MSEEVKTVTVTVREFAEAIRKNGLKQTIGKLWVINSVSGSDNYNYAAASSQTHDLLDYKHALNNDFYKEVYIGSACAFGQGLVNVSAEFDDTTVDDVFVSQFYGYVYELNDEAKMSFAQIADEILRDYANELDHKMTFNYFDYSPFIKQGE